MKATQMLVEITEHAKLMEIVAAAESLDAAWFVGQDSKEKRRALSEALRKWKKLPSGPAPVSERA